MRHVTIPGADAPRTRSVVLVALAVLLGLVGSLISAPQAARADEGVLFSLLNQARNGEGRSSLDRMAALDAVALEWAKAMAASGTLSHNQALRDQIPGGWSFIGENVARGYPSGSTMHGGWWNSSGHRANMLGDFTDVGIAFLSAGGSTWGVQVFARYGASLPPYSAPAPPQPAPAAAASPDTQPSVIDPERSRQPTLLPSPSATPSPSAESSSEPSASASAASEEPTSTASPWPIIGGAALVLLLVAAIAAALLVRRRRSQT